MELALYEIFPWFFGALIIVVYYFFNKNKKNNKNKTFSQFEDIYNTYEELQEGLREQGLESSNLIIGIDFTASNLYQGRRTFGGKSLHYINPNGDSLNPYQIVISTIGKTLSSFDEDGLIPVYGFGDIRTKDHRVFPLKPESAQYFNSGISEFCNGFSEVLDVYTNVSQKVTLSGPTNFAPLIRHAIEICKSNGRAEYHILVIICDGQVDNKTETAQAIVDASEWPISIICIGVGDGPWESMEEFDDELPARNFDNFQFVEYDKVMKDALIKRKDPQLHFALHALMEIPQQYKAIKKLDLLGKSSDTPYLSQK